MALASAIYDGTIRHRRFEPIEREFSYRIFMLYLDLEEIPEVMRIHPLWSTRRRSLVRFRRADYLGPAGLPLREAVGDLVETRTGRRPKGPIRMLTHLRFWGVIQNPVTFYYCFDREGDRLETVVAEVTNVPWGERHAYVIDQHHGARTVSASLPKRLHVSPLMAMNHEYELNFGMPGPTVPVHIESRREGQLYFDATLNLRRKTLNRALLGRLLLTRPPMSLKATAGIYYQAFRIWRKGVSFHSKPGA